MEGGGGLFDKESFAKITLFSCLSGEFSPSCGTLEDNFPQKSCAAFSAFVVSWLVWSSRDMFLNFDSENPWHGS